VSEDLNSELKRLAERDGLTGVYNRRFFNEYLEIEVKRAASHLQHRARLGPEDASGMNFGLALIDIDHFKRSNDDFGHLTGDEVLRRVAQIMERNMFSRDVICRYGGDEFALLLTKTSGQGILQAVEKIRKEIADLEFAFDAEHAREHITVSVGLAGFDEAPGLGSEEILRVADDRLLRAKSLGKNRIVHTDQT
jgi:diguanylate cyclase (GGDEF)-like protein